MSILSSVTSLVESTKIPVIGLPGENCKPDNQCNTKPEKDCKPTKPDDCGKQSKGDDEHKGRDDDHTKQAKYNDDHNGRDNDHRDNDHKDHEDHSKQANCDDDHKGREDDHSKQAKYDDHKNHDDHSKHDGGWKDAKNDCEPHKDECSPPKDACQPQKDHCEPKPTDDCGKGDTCHNPGEALAKIDFCNVGSPCPDHAGDIHSALASMSSDHALDFAIGQMGPADHFDVGHLDLPLDTSHDIGHHA
jgi:hypothetical protein